MPTREAGRLKFTSALVKALLPSLASKALNPVQQWALFFIPNHPPTMTEIPMTEKIKGPKPFTETIGALRYGTLNEDLSKALHELTQKCVDTCKSGELTLKIKLKPGSGGQVEVFDDIVVKAPKEPKGSSIMFATVEGHLQRQDPRQMQIDGLRTVDMETGELRKVG